MRLGRRQVGASLALPLCLMHARRAIHRHRSPDRSFTQEIQDRQNAFQWAKKHVFRPHQHFSYDPSSWSRSLEDKALKEHQLSLVQRVKLAQEHEAERSAHLTAPRPDDQARRGEPNTANGASRSPSSEGSDDIPWYFFSVDDATAASPAPASQPWESVSLQEMIDEVQRLDRSLHSRRYRGGASLARRSRQEEEFRLVLFQLFERLRVAELETTVTVDACAFGCFTLLQHVEALSEAVLASAEEPAESSEDVVRRIFAVLQERVLRPMAEGGVIYASAASGVLPLEAIIELLAVATAPFVRNCCGVFDAPLVEAGTLAAYAQWATALGHDRARATDEAAEDGGALREWVDPVHLSAWAGAVRQLHSRGLEVSAALLGITVQLEHAALYVSRTLEGVTGATRRGRLQASLQRSAPRAVEGEEGEERVGVRSPKPVVLDATAAPRGVQPPPTDCDDVSHLLSASTALVLAVAAQEPARHSTQVLDGHVRRLVAACLRMAAHAPNFDLEGRAVLQWACALLETDALLSLPTDRGATEGSEEEEDGVRLALRLLLLLSRLSWSDVVDRPLVGRLALLIMRWPQPAGASAVERAEWRRLRGLAMRAALDRTTCDDLDSAAATLPGVATWVESAAFGEYDGAVPLALWRAACERWLPLTDAVRFDALSAAPRGAAECSPAVAHALLVLCARYITREAQGRSAVTVNVHSLHTAHRVAACLAVFHGRAGLAQDLVVSPQLWETVAAESPEHIASLLSAMKAVVEQHREPSKVLNF